MVCCFALPDVTTNRQMEVASRDGYGAETFGIRIVLEATLKLMLTAT